MSAAAPSLTQADILAPLRFFYGLASQDLRVTFVDPNDLPATERTLLVHDRDMTPTLAQHYATAIALDVHARSVVGNNYLVRAVILRRSDDLQPVEFGAIGIHLDGFENSIRQLILEGRIPLGGLLHQHHIPHSSHPSGYFRIEIDHRLAGLLGGFDGQRCYGRCNELRHPDGSPIAEVVEVLPCSEA
jgi:chorismate-pyruvate lyase